MSTRVLRSQTRRQELQFNPTITTRTSKRKYAEKEILGCEENESCKYGKNFIFIFNNKELFFLAKDFIIFYGFYRES